MLCLRRCVYHKLSYNNISIMRRTRVAEKCAERVPLRYAAHDCFYALQLKSMDNMQRNNIKPHTQLFRLPSSWNILVSESVFRNLLASHSCVGHKKEQEKC